MECWRTLALLDVYRSTLDVLVLANTYSTREAEGARETRQNSMFQTRKGRGEWVLARVIFKAARTVDRVNLRAVLKLGCVASSLPSLSAPRGYNESAGHTD
mmetsp:Transcript_645/g.1693  ORF Transcript_645/g.1693 Transcript_645/m.1693 type:complete len:101 (+) Transcript_645:158-460(+)